MITRTGRAALALIAGMLVAGVCSQGATPDGLRGNIAGWVANSSGIPQMGATVLLFNNLDRLVQRSLTDDGGSFLFESLAPGVYSVRVSLASFLPALKRNIVVQPGMRSLLNVNLAGVLSSIELVYSATGSTPIMSDDWKWVLRSSNATRPVLRLSPRIDISDPGARRASAFSAFSETRGLVRISASDQGRLSQYSNEPDLGTAFALATSLFGDHRLQVSGNFAYSAATGIPAAGFRTSYSRGSPGEPSSRVSLTMRQWYLPARAGAGQVTGQQGATPALRTLSVGFLNRTDLSEHLRFEYGFSLDMVSFLETLNYFSPYGRLTYSLPDGSAAEFAFRSGVPPAELFPASKEMGNDLQQDLATLGLFPRVSLRNGQARVQRAAGFEAAYRKTVGSRTYSAGAYRELVTNAALTMTAPAGAVQPGNLLPDLFSNSAVFNAGDYMSAGYMASVTQALGDNLNLNIAGGSGSALVPSSQDLHGESPEELRMMLRRGQRRWAAARVSGMIPGTSTYFSTSYRWTDGRSLTAAHAYLMQTLRSDTGWNIYFRQPVPAFRGMRGRLEATADLRNLLAQGYLPLTTAQGRRFFLLHTPRSVRGGFNYVF